MGSKTCTYMLRTIRQLQPSRSIAGMNFPTFARSSRLTSALPVLSYACTLRSTVPIRCASYQNPPCSEAQNMASDEVDGLKNDPPASIHGDHASPLNEHICLKSNEMDSSFRMIQFPTFSTMIVLNTCTTPREVLNIFSGPSYGKDELFQGVLKLWHTFLALGIKQKLTERDFIVDHPHFRNLMNGISKTAPFFSPEALVRILYVIVRLAANQESKLIRSLLMICQKHLNSLNEKEITILANTLEFLKSDTRVEMVKSDLRLLMAMNIEEVLEVTPLLTMMKTLGRNAPLKLKLKLENNASQMVDGLNVAQSVNLFRVLADIDLCSEHLLNVCSSKLIDGIDELSYPQILSILSCCCELNYGNKKLLTAFGDWIMKTIFIWKADQLTPILKYFARLRFRYIPLMDRYADNFTNNLNSVKLWDLLETIEIYATLFHLPESNTQPFLEAVNTSLETHINSIPPRKLLYTLLNLCVLGLDPDIAINKLLQYERVLNYKEQIFFAHLKECLLKDKFFPNHKSSLRLKKSLPPVSEDIQNFHTVMKNFINDPDLYQHSVKIANMCYIDFILALDTQERKLVPIGDMDTDDQQITTDSTRNIARIAVLCCNPDSFTLDTLHPVGKLAFKIKNIESLGFSVVLVPIHRVMSLTEEERVEFMKTTIFQELTNANALETKE